MPQSITWTAGGSARVSLEGYPVTSLPVIAGFDFAVCVLPVPRRARYGQDQVVVILLAPMLIRIVGRTRVDLHAEGEQFLLEHLGQRKRFGYLQPPVLEEGLDGCHQIPLGYTQAVQKRSLQLVGYRRASVDGDGDGADALSLERIDHGPPHARRIDQKPRVIQAFADGRAEQESLYARNNLCVLG